MKNIKRVIAAMLLAVIALTATACHKKDEIAVTAKTVKFTSAYYMCALINADSEAKTKVQENLTEEEKQSTDINYYSKKIDDKEYKTWVKDKALDYLKGIAAYKLLCADNKVELDDEMKANAEYMGEYYWSYSSAYFEPNGVSKETYIKYSVDSAYSEAYFNHLYGKEGTKAIADKDVKAEIHGNYVIAEQLNASYTSEMTDKEKTALKKKLEAYVKAINSGEKTFEQVYNEYIAIKESDKEERKHGEGEEVSEPKSEYAQIFGAEGTNYESEHYVTVKKLKTGSAKLIELEDKSGFILLVKQDIKADDYYLEALDSAARHTLKDEEFEKEIEAYKATFKLDVNSYAVNQFKVDKIIEPDYSNTGY